MNAWPRTPNYPTRSRIMVASDRAIDKRGPASAPNAAGPRNSRQADCGALNLSRLPRRRSHESQRRIRPRHLRSYWLHRPAGRRVACPALRRGRPAEVGDGRAARCCGLKAACVLFTAGFPAAQPPAQSREPVNDQLREAIQTFAIIAARRRGLLTLGWRGRHGRDRSPAFVADVHVGVIGFC